MGKGLLSCVLMPTCRVGADGPDADRWSRVKSVPEPHLRISNDRFSTLLHQNAPYARRVLRVLATSGGIALLGSVGSWLLQTSLAAPPIYLINLPLCLGIPLFLLGAPILLVSAPEPYVRVYSWGAIGLGLLLAATWCVTAFIDPHATHPFTQTGLLFGWMAGGTIYEVLLIVLMASS